jgi:hypothetical protein
MAPTLAASEVHPTINVYVIEVNMNIGLPMFGTVVFPAVRRLRQRLSRLVTEAADEDGEDGGPILRAEDKDAA